MEKLINHHTNGVHKRYMRRHHSRGAIRRPRDAFQVPVLTTTNRFNTIAEQLYGSDPLFIVDRRTPKKWTWLEKTLSAKEKSLEFLAAGHDYFIYIDSDDAILWQAPTVDLCARVLQGRDMLFQESNHGFPRQHEFGGNKHFVKLFGSKGPCAGAYIARTEMFWKYCDIILSLQKAEAKVVTIKDHFDDQAGWKTVTMLCSDKVHVDRPRRFLTTLREPNYDEIL